MLCIATRSNKLTRKAPNRHRIDYDHTEAGDAYPQFPIQICFAAASARRCGNEATNWNRARLRLHAVHCSHKNRLSAHAFVRGGGFITRRYWLRSSARPLRRPRVAIPISAVASREHAAKATRKTRDRNVENSDERRNVRTVPSGPVKPVLKCLGSGYPITITLAMMFTSCVWHVKKVKVLDCRA